MRIGQLVSHYKILQKLGEGGMGVVYKAEDTALDRTVALKFFRPEVMGGDESKSRLVREARAASKLDHPNICTIHQIEEAEDGSLFICMGYCEGESLRNRISDAGSSIEWSIDTAIQIAEGLAHAHDQGIVHRDIKPENIIIGENGRARIMDFGLAKLVGQSTILKTGTVAGTLPYMSPEQVKGGDVDHRSDVWSLGAVLYQLLTGRPPFAGQYEAAVLYSIAYEPATPPREIREDMPPDLEGVVLKALEKNPEDRYCSMREMLEDLRGVRAALPGAEGTGDVSPGRYVRRPRRAAGGRRALILVGALAAIVTVVVLVKVLGVNALPVTVAVMDFKNSTGEESLDEILGSLLTTDLAQSPRVRVLGKERMRELEEGAGAGEMDKPSGFELAERAGVQVMISGRALKMGDRIRVDASVYDVPSRELLFARSEEGDGPDSIFDMIDGLSKSIRKELKVLPRWKAEAEDPLSELTTGSVEAYRLYTKGVDLRTAQPLQAVEYLKQAVTFDPKFVEAYLELTLLYKYQLGDYEMALSSARDARDLSMDRSAKEHLKALIYEYWVTEDWDSVMENMREYLRWQPNDMRIQRRLGWVLAQREETYEEAISQFRKVIEMDPKNVSGEVSDAYNHLGNLFLFLGRTEEAVAAFEKYGELKPGRPDPMHSLGNAYMLSGRYEEALAQFGEVLKSFPRYYITHESMGLTYLAMGKWRDALSSFRRDLTVVPEEYLPEGHVRIAEVFCKQQEFLFAEDEIEKALKLDPACVKAHWMRGVVAIENGDLAKANDELGTVRGLLEKPRAAGKICYLHHLRGRVDLAEGRMEEGLSSLKKAVDTCSRFESYYFERELARGYIDAGSPDDAIDVASSLLRRNPNDGETLILGAMAYKRKGAPDKMVEYLDRAKLVWKEADADFKPLVLALALKS